MQPDSPRALVSSRAYDKWLRTVRGLSQVLALILIKLVFPCARQPWEAQLKDSSPPPKLKQRERKDLS